MGNQNFLPEKRESVEINDMFMEFHFVMRYMVEELSDVKIILCDVYKGSMDLINNPERYGKISNLFFLSFVAC